jgi:RimJ/RimL family protein N-acetyltransferase
MKINETTSLLSPKILLVPYSAHHVPQYHTWMQDAELQKLTASEPLSMEEEYEMQRSWRNDGDKLTFIACLPITNSEGRNEKGNGNVVQVGIDDADEKMIGDVNLFLSEDDEDDEDENDDEKHEEAKKVIGELEIMVASPSARGKGLGKATLLIFLWYITTNIFSIISEYTTTKNTTLKYLRVKISASNEISIKLFERVGFTKTSPTPNYFGEVELRLSISDTVSLFKDIQEPSIALYRLPVVAKEA